MKVSIWIVLLIVVIVGLALYFSFKKKTVEPAATKPPVVVINKQPGSMWTKDELKAQGYTDAQITSAAQTASNVGMSIFGF